MGLLAFAEFCRESLMVHPDTPNPYDVHGAALESLAGVVYLHEFWYGFVVPGSAYEGLYARP